jgi:hypothetical protein
MEGEVGLLRSDEQMPGTVTRVPAARVSVRLGIGVGSGLGGEHHCRRLIDAQRAIDHGESRTSASRITSREIYANRIPLRDSACRGLADNRSVDRRRPSRRTAATLTRSGQAEPARATRRWSKQVRPHGAADRGSCATRKKCDPRRARVMMHMPQFGSCQVTRAADPLILNSAARTRCPVDLVGDADHTLPGRVGPRLPTTNRASRWWHREGKSNHGCL